MAGSSKCFQGELLLVIKDVVETGAEAAVNDFNRHIERLAQESDVIMTERGVKESTFFVNQMYKNGLSLIPYPPLANKAFFRELNETLQPAFDDIEVLHEGGKQFLSHIKLIMAKLHIGDWSAMSGEQAKIRATEIRANLPNAVEAGAIIQPKNTEFGVTFEVDDDQNLLLLDGNKVIQTDLQNEVIPKIKKYKQRINACSENDSKIEEENDSDIDDSKTDNEKSISGVQRVSTKLIIGADDQYTGIGKNREFVDFAPLVFKYIRNYVLGISDESYNKSIIPIDKYAQRNILDAKFGEGKSGAFFYFSHDSRYLVKTIKKFEVEVMLNTLTQYVEYIIANPNTILSRIIGLHSIRLYGLTKYFVVSENVFLSKLKPSEVYDLKGSWVGRYTKYGIDSGKTLKDGDLKRFIVLNTQCRKQLINQLDRDSKFLSQINIMDYSLLLGIYHLKMVTNNNDDDDDNNINNYAGGIRAQIIEGPGLYFMGIIDTLQVYNFKKKMENFAKTYIKRDDSNGISCVEPIKYQQRFMNYMKNIIVTDEEYFYELNVPKKQFQNQNVAVYPGKQAVDKCMKEAQQQKNNNPQNINDF
eukprot:539575_1